MPRDHTRPVPHQNDLWNMSSFGTGRNSPVSNFPTHAQERHTGPSPSTSDTPEWMAKGYQWICNMSATQNPNAGNFSFPLPLNPPSSPSGNYNASLLEHGAQGSSTYPAFWFNFPQPLDFPATFTGHSQPAATTSGVGQCFYPLLLNAHCEEMEPPRLEIPPNTYLPSSGCDSHATYDPGSAMLMEQPLPVHFEGYLPNVPSWNANCQVFTPDESGRHEAPAAVYARSIKLITQAADPPTNLGLEQGVRIYFPSPRQSDNGPASLVASPHPPARYQSSDFPLSGSSDIGSSTSLSPVRRFEDSKSDPAYLNVPSRMEIRGCFRDVVFDPDLVNLSPTFTGDSQICTNPISRARNQYSRIDLSASPSRSPAHSQAHTPLSSGSSIGMPSRQQSPSEPGEHINVVDLLYTFVDRDTVWTGDDIPRLISLCQDELLKRGRNNFSDLFSKDIKPEVGTKRSRADRKKRQKKGSRYFCHLNGCLSSFTRKYGFSNHLGSHIGLTDRVCSTCGRYYCASSITRHEVACARKHTSNQHLLAAGGTS